MTETQNLFISDHPVLKNMFIAGGGSFSAAKLAPIIGAEINAVVTGTKRPSNYSSESQDGIAHSHPQLVPRADFRELNAEAEKEEPVQRWLTNWNKAGNRGPFRDII